MLNYIPNQTFYPCRKCHNKNRYFPKGYIVSEMEDGKGLYVKECECHKTWNEEQLLYLNLKQARINQSYIKYDIDFDYYPSQTLDEVVPFVKKYIQFFQKSERTRAAWVFFSGMNGTQKTSIGFYIGKELIKLKYKVRYILMNDLIKLLMKAERDEEAQEELYYLSTIDLLILDEAFDTSKITIYKTQYQLPFIDTFLRNRLNYRKGIIFISNCLIETIDKKVFGESLRDLVTRQIAQEKSFILFPERFSNHLSKISNKGLFSED